MTVLKGKWKDGDQTPNGVKRVGDWLVLAVYLTMFMGCAALCKWFWEIIWR